MCPQIFSEELSSDATSCYVHPRIFHRRFSPTHKFLLKVSGSLPITVSSRWMAMDQRAAFEISPLRKYLNGPHTSFKIFVYLPTCLLYHINKQNITKMTCTNHNEARDLWTLINRRGAIRCEQYIVMISIRFVIVESTSVWMLGV